MAKDIKEVVRTAAEELIRESTTSANIQKSYALHKEKIHFIPARYRVLGGILQSLNIKFGNFIEKLLDEIVENDTHVKQHRLSGKKITLYYTLETDALIDSYISRRQMPTSADLCDDDFSELLKEIKKNEGNPSLEKQPFRKDVDALFYAQPNHPVYVEVKYNDDHDTGKFVDINRKFIKTYAGLLNIFEGNELENFVPYIYYFNPTKRWGPIYCPSSHIKRGEQLFDQFFETKFSDVDSFLREIGDDPEVIGLFDDLYETIRNQL